MVQLLSEADYPVIRAALDTELDEADLPDSIIDQIIYAPAAVRDVIDRYSTAESETGEDFYRCKRAAIYFCAARLAPVVVRLTSQTVQARDLSYSKPTFDPEQRAAELRQMAEAELALIVSEDVPTKPTMFTVARGYRGR